MKKRQRRLLLRRLGIPSDVVGMLAKGSTCDCGQPASYVGTFYVVVMSGQVKREAMLLCEQCAGQCDGGVQLTRLE